VRGIAQRYVADQRVIVRFYRRGRKIAVRQVALLPSASGRSGYFVMSFRARTPGRISVQATKVATPAQGELVARPVAVEVLPLRARPGARGRAVRSLQRMLRGLGYVVGKTGLYDARTARAVLAFRKVTGMARSTEASSEVFRRLARGQGRFRVRFPDHGRHVEAHLGHQVLALIDKGLVLRIYPTSSGAPISPTVLGHFRVYLKTFGVNAKGMVHSSYFIRGYAIHGYYTVPTYPASHGCLRIPTPEALSVFRWVHVGTRVDVYR
jgi:hypothetical protein